MNLGELTGGGLRAYYRMEDENDSSPNGNHLTNSGSVIFSRGRINLGADFGSSGDTQSLTYGANVFSTDTPDEVAFLLTFKFNSISNTSRNHNIFVATSKTSATDGRTYQCFYSIASGVVTLTGRRTTVSGNVNATISFTPDIDAWYFIRMRFTRSSLTQLVLNIINLETMEILSGTNNSSAVGNSQTTNPSVFLSIGNNRNQAASAYVIIDEFIIDENTYVKSPIADPNQVSNLRKYITQLKGFL